MIAIKAGAFNTLQEITSQDLNEPQGWIDIDFHEPIHTFHLQVSILQNHQNGKDTHVRQLKVFSTHETPFRMI